MVKISLCMIVFNEEKNIARCLKSVRGIVCEIVAVDTGSTDNTKQILRDYGAKVFDFKWQGDFSAARNYAISKTSGDYLLFLDADERLKLHKPQLFKKYLEKCGCDLIPLSIINFYGNRADIRHSNISGGLRLAKNNGCLRFINNIHEKIDTTGKKIDLSGVAGRHMHILHYGYMQKAFKNKNNRNLMLLTASKTEQPHSDAWNNYFLAAEYYRRGETEKAYQKINNAILLFIGSGIKPPSIAYKLKYDLLITKHNFTDAYNGIIKAVTLYPDYVDLHFYKGILQFASGEYQSAKTTFCYCLILGESNLNYLILSGAGSFLALYYLGLCYQKLNQPNQAISAFSQSEALYPHLEKRPEFKHYLPS